MRRLKKISNLAAFLKRDFTGFLMKNMMKDKELSRQVSKRKIL
jgi:hypothetical protein